MEYLETIQDAIGKGFKCKATHIKTVPVHLKHEGETMWEGEVEVFEIKGHPKAKRAYGWGFETEKGKAEFATVLELPPVDSPDTAVKAYLASRF
jgi:hypothetical protein